MRSKLLPHFKFAFFFFYKTQGAKIITLHRASKYLPHIYLFYLVICLSTLPLVLYQIFSIFKNILRGIYFFLFNLTSASVAQIV